VSVLNGSNLFYYQPWPMTVGPLSVAGHFLSALTEQEIFRLSELDRTCICPWRLHCAISSRKSGNRIWAP